MFRLYTIATTIHICVIFIYLRVKTFNSIHNLQIIVQILLLIFLKIINRFMDRTIQLLKIETEIKKKQYK